MEQAIAINIPLREEIRELLHACLVQQERQLLSLIHQKAPERLLGFLQNFSAT